MLDSSGWRRHAPAGASVLVHAVLLTAVAGMMATALPPSPDARRQVVLAVELLTDPELVEPVPLAGVTPPPRIRAPRPADAPTTSAEAPAPRPAVPTAPIAPTGRKPGEDSVYLGPPSILNNPGAPPGLASLMGKDTCEARFGPKAKECAGRELAARTGTMDSVMPRSRQELAQHFAAYMPTCPYLVGCEPAGEYITPSGTRAPPPQSPMSAGAEGLGGIHDSVGRLDFNPDHFDRGFGD